jgi:hypothetical protein
VIKSESLNLLGPSGPVKACNGIALPITLSNLRASFSLDLFKVHLAGKRLTTDADLKKAVIWLQTLDSGLWYSRMQVLIPRWDNFLQVIDENLEF